VIEARLKPRMQLGRALGGPLRHALAGPATGARKVPARPRLGHVRARVGSHPRSCTR
jgi:hypothetical protein